MEKHFAKSHTYGREELTVITPACGFAGSWDESLPVVQ